MEDVSLEMAEQLILQNAGIITRTKDIPVLESNGYNMAEDLRAPLDNPPFHRSPIDGYAARSGDLQGASPDNPVCLTVTGCIYAGSVYDGTAESGQAIRIMTGAPIPEGCDCTIRQEDTDYGEETVHIFKEIRKHENFCFRGEDYHEGELLLEKGRRITFAEQGVLSSVGQAVVKVFEKPVIYLLTTGDEVQPPGLPLTPGKIYNSNGIMVAARLAELGMPVTHIEHVCDDEAVMAARLKQVCQSADIVVTTGGVSVGKKDIMHGALKLLGAQRIFWKVQIQPGTPTVFSVFDNTPILSLSGNPFGAMANVELLLRPLLAKMGNAPELIMRRKEAVFCGEFPKRSKRRRFVRAHYEDGQVSVTKGIFSSGSISSLRGCNCLLEVKAGTNSIGEGEKVCVWLL